MSVRHDLAAQLRDAWRDHPVLREAVVVARERALSDPKVPHVLVRQVRYGKLPQAPQAAFQAGMELVVVSRYTDPDKAADELDELVPAILAWLRPRYLYDEAELADYADRLAYVIPMTVHATTTPEETP